MLLKLEFNNAIKETEVQPTRAAARKGNIEKNQNPRIVPCKPTTFSIPFRYDSTANSFQLKWFFCIVADDHNRVILEPEDGVPDSDYINASYVDVSNS